MKLNKTRFLLVIILIAILGDLVYLYPKLGFSPVPTQWGASSAYGRLYIIQHGFVHPFKLDSLTWQSGITDYASVDLFPKILAAIISIICGKVGLIESEQFHQNLSWVGTVFLPIVVLYFYSFLSKKEGNSNYIDIIILYLFGMFHLAGLIASLSLGASAANSIARALFLLTVILLIIILDEQKRNWKHVFIFLILVISFYHFHHTWSYYLLLYLIAVTICIVKSKDKRFTKSLPLFSIILFFMLSLYSNTKLFQEPVMLIKSFPKILINFPSVSYTSKVNENLLGYQSLGSIYSYVQLIGSFLIILLFIIYLTQYIPRQKIASLYEKVIFYLIVAQALVIWGLFMWDGLAGVYSRVLEPATYISMLLSSYILVKSKGKLKSISRFILLCIVFTTVFSYLNSPTELNTQVKNSEFNGIDFAGKHIPTNSNIFSDFRLGTPLLYYNQQGIITIDSVHSTSSQTEELLSKCYYNVSRPETILDMLKNSDRYYVLLSSFQTKICLLDSSLTPFKPAEIDFQEKWNNEKGFSKVYSSKYVEIFNRNA